MQTTLSTEQLSKIAYGLGHPIRAKIDEILETKPRMKVTDLVEKLKEHGDAYSKDYSNIRKHLVMMQDAGIITMRKDIKEGYIVELVMDVSIMTKPVSAHTPNRNLIPIS